MKNKNVDMKDIGVGTRELLVGLLLGDGFVGRSGNKAFITLEQGSKHKSYVYYVHKLLIDAGIPLYPIKCYSRSDKRYNNVNSSVYFKSHNLETLNFLADMFISDGKKVVSPDIAKWMTPICLAHWICGDGQYVEKGGITLCTDNYTLPEVKTLIAALQSNFNADCSIHNKKVKNGNLYYRIYIKKASFNAIKPLILEYVHESFLYKLHK